MRLLNEPTAAAVAYGLDKKGKDQKIVVFDFGGGTHDVSILELGDGVFEVLSTDGDTHLGGDDVDEKIINWLADEFKAEEDMDLRKDPMSLQRLKEAAEKAAAEGNNNGTPPANIDPGNAIAAALNMEFAPSADMVDKYAKLGKAMAESMKKKN